MKVLIKYWYIILVTALLSGGAAIGMLYLRKGEWMPPPVDPLAKEREKSALANMSKGYVKWNFELVRLEDLRENLEAERGVIEQERQELESLRSQVDQEVAEMKDLRAEINRLRRSVQDEFFKIEVSEEENLKRLAKVYGAMKPVPIVELFKQMDIELVVKIMSVMPAETSAGILEQMTEEKDDKRVIESAVLITEKLRKLQK